MGNSAVCQSGVYILNLWPLLLCPTWAVVCVGEVGLLFTLPAGPCFCYSMVTQGENWTRVLQIWLLYWETAVDENYRYNYRIWVMQKYEKSEAMKSLEWHFVEIGRNCLETYGMGSCSLLCTESHVLSKLSSCYTHCLCVESMNKCIAHTAAGTVNGGGRRARAWMAAQQLREGWPERGQELFNRGFSRSSMNSIDG